MELADDLAYASGENVIGFDQNGLETFSAKVMENGWDNDINQLRLNDSRGELNVGYTILGTKTGLRGIVESVNQFNLDCDLDVSREKINDFGDRVGFLNDYQQRISDNNYYQKFSYSIKSDVNYQDWKEAVKSLVHPAGFKEFSDLDIIQKASNSMKVGIGDSSLSTSVSIDGSSSMYSRNNFSMVLEDEQSADGSIERIFFPQGVELKSYLLSRTNKVLRIDDFSDQFTGFTTSLGGQIVGLTTFKLKNNGTPLFYREFSGLSTSTINLENNRFNLTNHNFQSGQKLLYGIAKVNATPVASAQTTIDTTFSYPVIDESFDSEILSFDSSSYTMDSNWYINKNKCLLYIMAKLGINTGTTPNDGTGDTLLSAALKINQNFNEIYSAIGNGTSITNQIAYSSVSGLSSSSNYAAVSGISSGLTGNPNVTVGILTAGSGDVVIGGATTSLIVGGDVSVGINTNDGLILTSENGTRYRLFVNNDGSLSTVAI